MLAKNLPYGDQRRLEIARALATEPQLILLDEPAAGMNPAESAELNRLIEQIRGQRAVGAVDRTSHESRDGHFRPHRRAGIRRARSPKARRRKSATIRKSSRPIWAAKR